MSVNDHRLNRVVRAARAARAQRDFVLSELEVPNIIDFVLSPQFLHVPRLYPIQALLLKLIFLQLELLTDFDHEVLKRWASGFVLADEHAVPLRYSGRWGIPADTLDRIERLRAQGRRCFREVVMVIGRRGGKNFLGSLCGAYVLWHLLSTGNPQAHYEIDSGKHLAALVFAGQKAQARGNQWADIAQRLVQAPCFQLYVEDVRSDVVRLWTPAQLASGAKGRGEWPLIEISAREATLLASRGPAAYMEFFDEMAYMQASGSNRSAEEVFAAATPALAQFGPDAFIFETSSPWAMIGRFYENAQRALELDPESRLPIADDTLLVQLPSWVPYEGYERTHDGLAAYPGGPTLPVIRRPIITRGDLEAEAARDPVSFAVEYEAQWASSPAAYLPLEDIRRMFGSWRGTALEMRTTGLQRGTYTAHADPSVSGANFAIVIAHAEEDGDRVPHAVIDYMHVWRPSDFADGRIHYTEIEDALCDLIQSFPTRELTFDQFSSAATIDHLNRWVREHRDALPIPTNVHEHRATHTTNWVEAETFKRALNERLVHAPHHDLAFAELQFLEVNGTRVDHPKHGPVTTSDLADCLFVVVSRLVGRHFAAHDALSGLGLRATGPGGLPISAQDASVNKALSGVGQTRRFSHAAQRGYNPGGGGRFRPR